MGETAMQRTVTTPADLTGDALDDLKGWLGISRSQEDAMLTGLLGASLALCEAFTRQIPIEQTYEERIPSKAGRYELVVRPVKALLTTQEVDASGARADLDEQDYAFEIGADRIGCITLKRALDAPFIAVSVRAGIAPDWASLPGALKQGIIRLAAFHYRDRESAKDPLPPASVAALWRPWRIARLT
jgi:uncharacterized phiE125 gp8 family phage protein